MCAALLASSAEAAYPSCTRPPTSQDKDAAKGLHQTAKQYFAKALYDQAVARWTEAYTFDCNAHIFLVNIGNSYEKLGQGDKAIEAFRLYVTRSGAEADPGIVEKVKNLEAAAAANAAPPPPDKVAGDGRVGTSGAGDGKPDGAGDGKPDGAGDGKSDGTGGGKPDGTGGGKPDGTDAASEPLIDPALLPWLVVGGGGALALTGGILLGVGTVNASDARKRCTLPGGACPPEVAESGTQANLLKGVGGGVLGLGVAAIGGGLAWHFLSGDPAEAAGTGEPPATKATSRSTWQVAPIVAGDFVGASAFGTF